MKVKVEGSHDIRTIEHVKSIVILPDDGTTKQSLSIVSVQHNQGEHSLTIKEADNG